jgi:hypothetical protein
MERISMTSMNQLLSLGGSQQVKEPAEDPSINVDLTPVILRVPGVR